MDGLRGTYLARGGLTGPLTRKSTTDASRMRYVPGSSGPLWFARAPCMEPSMSSLCMLLRRRKMGDVAAGSYGKLGSRPVNQLGTALTASSVTDTRFFNHVRVTCVSEVTLDSEDVDEAALCILVLAPALRSLC